MVEAQKRDRGVDGDGFQPIASGPGVYRVAEKLWKGQDEIEKYLSFKEKSFFDLLSRGRGSQTRRPSLANPNIGVQIVQRSLSALAASRSDTQASPGILRSLLRGTEKTA